MLLRLRNAAASMTELTRQQERTANNLANANTVGFRRDRAFTEVLQQTLDAERAPTSARAQRTWADPAAGALDATGNPLDLALNGEGFFATEDAAGAVRYTRAGRFTTDPAGFLRTPDGAFVRGEAGRIQLPPGAAVEVTSAGAVRAGATEVGRLQVVRFAPDAAFTKVGDAAFTTTAAPEAVAAPDVRQGFVEGSNVNALAEMTDMIAGLRLFETQQKVIQTHDALLGRVTQDLGKF